jgi:hypothetical protein
VSGRMNWDRVRTENLAHLHGSEWVSPFANASLARNKKGKNKKEGARRKKPVPLAARMVGCTCGKAIGFTGLHKKKCPLCRTQASMALAEHVAVVAHSDEARPAVERTSAAMPKLTILASTRRLENSVLSKPSTGMPTRKNTSKSKRIRDLRSKWTSLRQKQKRSGAFQSVGQLAKEQRRSRRRALEVAKTGLKRPLQGGAFESNRNKH